MVVSFFIFNLIDLVSLWFTMLKAPVKKRLLNVRPLLIEYKIFPNHGICRLRLSFRFLDRRGQSGPIKYVFLFLLTHKVRCFLFGQTKWRMIGKIKLKNIGVEILWRCFLFPRDRRSGDHTAFVSTGASYPLCFITHQTNTHGKNA